MKISELIDQLEELEQEHGDLDVIAAYQPTWPLTGTIFGACVVDEDDDTEDDDAADDEPTVVWIAIGDHPRDRSPYAPDQVFEVAQ